MKRKCLKKSTHKKLEVSDLAANLYFKAINSKDGVWMNPVSDKTLYTPHVINSIGKIECFLIPIYTENKVIGLIYSDQAINKKPLTEDDFKIVKHFSQQAIIGLTLFRTTTK